MTDTNDEAPTPGGTTGSDSTDGVTGSADGTAGSADAVDGTGEEPDREALRRELGEIKRAVGLHESHPYWWRWWLVEGLGVAALFPLFNVGFRYGFSMALVAALVAVFLAHQFALYRIQRAYDEPASGVPDWGTWHLAFFAGLAAWIVGLSPIIDAVDGLAETPITWVGAGIVIGVAFMYMGQLLGAYGIRRADRNAFYVGGCWVLAVSAALPWVPIIDGWEFAALGLAYGGYCVVAYAVLARI